jgi:hypothetical protein
MTRNGNCFNCGEWGHFSRDRAGNWTCPWPPVERPTQPGPWPPQPPKYVRDQGPKADSHAWADRIRAQMGWSKLTPEEREEAYRQQTASRQLEDSRRDRESEHAA